MIKGPQYLLHGQPQLQTVPGVTSHTFYRKYFKCLEAISLESKGGAKHQFQASFRNAGPRVAQPGTDLCRECDSMAGMQVLKKPKRNNSPLLSERA